MKTIIIVLIIVFVIYKFGKNKSVSTPADNRYFDKSYSLVKQPGMYFMYAFEAHEKLYKETSNRFFDYSTTYYLALAYACQGRTDDLNSIYIDFKENESELSATFIEYMQDHKKDIYLMNKVAKRIDESNMTDMRDTESTGEYADRKLLASKVFKEKYDYFVSFDFVSFYDSTISQL